MVIQKDEDNPEKPIRESPNVIISNLPKEATGRGVTQFAEEGAGPVRKCFFVRDKDHVFTGMAYVSFESAEIAKKAVEELNHCTFDGVTVNVKPSKAKKSKHEDSKPVPVYTIKDGPPKEEDWKDKRGYLKLMRSKIQNGRVVVRNINRGCSEEGLRKLFKDYGEILELVVLKLSDGRPKGVAFIQYGSAKHASAAISKCNASKFMGKTIAVDLAVPKDLYQSKESKSEENIPAVKQEPMDFDNKDESRLPTITKFADDDLCDDKVKDENEGVSDFCGEQGDPDSESDEEESEKKKELDRLLNKKSKKKERKEKAFTHKPISNDVLEKRSLFIRSIAYDCDESTITKLLSKFGEVKHVLFCRDKANGRFKGTAFAQFITKEGSDACLEAYEDPAFKKDFFINGRTLYISIAIGRDDVLKVKEEKVDPKKKKTKDKRNLYLAKEGLIKEGTKAADGLSKQDLGLRKQRAMNSKKMLQNLHIFVSTTRISIHNLDLGLSDIGLKILVEANSPKGTEINECRIMRNMYELDDSGKPQSKGYGFVNFTRHEHALAALRQLNNNPDIFTPRNRPIVEFSLENRAALNAKERRMQMSKDKNPTTVEYKKIEKAKLEEQQQEEQEPTQTKAVYTPQPYAGNQSHPVKKSKKITRNQVNNTARRQFKGNKNKYAKKKQKVSKTSKRKIRNATGGPAKKRAKS